MGPRHASTAHACSIMVDSTTSAVARTSMVARLVDSRPLVAHSTRVEPAGKSTQAQVQSKPKREPEPRVQDNGATDDGRTSAAASSNVSWFGKTLIRGHPWRTVACSSASDGRWLQVQNLPCTILALLLSLLVSGLLGIKTSCPDMLLFCCCSSSFIVCAQSCYSNIVCLCTPLVTI